MILVTGATGFLGSQLLLQLTNSVVLSQKIVALYRNKAHVLYVEQLFEKQNKKAHFQKIDWKQANILDIPALEMTFEGVKIVYHCAALISFDPANEEQLRKTNIEGTANVVNCCLDFDVQKLCYVSSIAALGDLLPHETIITEKTEWNPEQEHSDYAISKYGAEMEVFRAQQEGLSVIVVNPGVILGEAMPGKWNDGSAKIFETVANNLKFFTRGQTGFVDVSDVVKIMQLLMESDIENQKFIVVSENWSYERLTKSIAKALNVKAPSFEAKKWQTNIAWRMDWLISRLFFRKILLSKSMANSLHSKDFYDHSKIKKTLDFEFKPLEETISATAFCFRQKS